MNPPVPTFVSGPSAGPFPSGPAIPSGDRPTYSSDEGLSFPVPVGTHTPQATR